MVMNINYLLFYDYLDLDMKKSPATGELLRDHQKEIGKDRKYSSRVNHSNSVLHFGHLFELSLTDAPHTEQMNV